MSCSLKCLTGPTMILSTACHGEARQTHELWQCNPDENEQQPGDGHKSWGLFGHGFFFLYLDDSLAWAHVSCEITPLGAHNAWDCLEPFPLRVTVSHQLPARSLPKSSSWPCPVPPHLCPDTSVNSKFQTTKLESFKNAVPTCQHFPSCLFRPSAAEFLPAPKLNHFSLLLSLPTEYWVVQALHASALFHPPLKVKWRSCLIILSLDSPWCTDSRGGGGGGGGSGMAHPLLW